MLSLAIEKTIFRKEAIIDGIEMHFTWPGRPVLQFHLGEAGITVNVQPSYRNKCTRWDIYLFILLMYVRVSITVQTSIDNVHACHSRKGGSTPKHSSF